MTMDGEQRAAMSQEMYGDPFGGLQRRVGTALAAAEDDPAARGEALAAELVHLAGVLDMVRGRLTDLERATRSAG
jgi:hypothetical protein